MRRERDNCIFKYYRRRNGIDENRTGSTTDRSSVAKESQEVIQVAALKNLDTGTKISPQFSILAIMDVLYSYYFANDSYFKTQKYKATLSAIRAKGEHTEDKDE